MEEIENNKEIEKVERRGMGYINFPKLDLTIDDIYDNFSESHQKYKFLVQEICDGWSLATNSDFLLYIEVLRVLGLIEVTSGKNNFIFKIKRENLKKIIPSESIRRCRQSLNSKGLCLATDERILQIRAKREIAVRNFFASEKYKERAKVVK
jgi:hypothetical protein